MIARLVNVNCPRCGSLVSVMWPSPLGPHDLPRIIAAADEPGSQAHAAACGITVDYTMLQAADACAVKGERAPKPILERLLTIAPKNWEEALAKAKAIDDSRKGGPS